MKYEFSYTQVKSLNSEIGVKRLTCNRDDTLVVMLECISGEQFPMSLWTHDTEWYASLSAHCPVSVLPSSDNMSVR